MSTWRTLGFMADAVLEQLRKIEDRLASLETKMQVVVAVGGLLGTFVVSVAVLITVGVITP